MTIDRKVTSGHVQPVGILQDTDSNSDWRGLSSSNVDRSPEGQLRTREEIYALVSPAVVYMKSTDNSSHHSSRSHDLGDPSATYGSGFIFDADQRIVVTNWHVVEDQKQVQVEVGKITVTAIVLGADINNDLAILQLPEECQSLARVSFGNPHSMNVGNEVFTIGAPFGFTGTLGQGCISGRSLNLPTAKGQILVDAIRHNAVTNPGNSGGPLINSYGQIIGMNSIIITESGNFAGLCFSVPIDRIQRSVSELLSTGIITEPYLGLHIADTVDHGAVVTNITEGSPADLAGLAASMKAYRGTRMEWTPRLDLSECLVVTAVNDHPISREQDLVAALSHNTGESVKVSFKGPGGKTFAVDLTPARRPVPDMLQIRSVLDKVTDLAPPCEHLRIVKEDQFIAREDINTLLQTAPFFAVFSRNARNLNVYLNSEKALSELAEVGKDLEWFDQQMKVYGFKFEQRPDHLAYSVQISPRDSLHMATILEALVHGKEIGRQEYSPQGSYSLADLLRQLS